jgi:hypothetical protein
LPGIGHRQDNIAPFPNLVIAVKRFVQILTGRFVTV